ncbi:LANO_0H08504g1_1 [Lachancea nothofagi CBS 11611]|uniref:LANO_0H08504g1_1 n=1 Tax=Lachancea nothofagi CBS 11611 TaxID=1266666 RepID=A0A1G4KLY9_9SACH|nr:LANO_0H08504g1_1 [Lachancea nothofagi CBS 11611]
MSTTGTEVILPTERDQAAVVDGVDKLAPAHANEEKASKDVPEEKIKNLNASEIERTAVDASYVGWKQIGGWEEKDQLTLEDELLDVNSETFLDNLIPDKLYGDWYHAAAVFFVGGTLSFLVGKLRLSLAPVFFIILSMSFLYRATIKRYRATIRDQVQKEFTVQKVEGDLESMEWLNSFLDKYWTLLEPEISQMVVQQANEILATNPSVPSFVKALWIDQFTLGVKPFRIDLVKTYQNTDSDVVVMDWGISFTPHDLSDLNSKQLKNYVNQKTTVNAKVFGLPLSVTVSDVAFKARLKVRFKLMTPFPHIETVNIQLLDVPDVDFVAKLLGETVFNWEIMNIPGLYPLIRELGRKYMAPIFMPPFSLQLNVPQLLSGSAVSIGILEVTVKDAVDIKRALNILNKSVDPYLSFEFNGVSVGKTRTVRDSLNPVWNETFFLLLNSFTEPLSIVLYDRREKVKDKVLGRIEYNLSTLHDEKTQVNLSSRFLRNSKPVGDLNFNLKFHPTLEPKQLPDGTVQEVPDLNVGISKICIEEAKELEEPGLKVSTYVELYFNAKLVLTTGTLKNTENPVWNQEYEAAITDRRKTRAKIVIKNAKGEIIGSTVQSLNDLIDRTEVDKLWVPLQNGKGQIKISTFWKPVELDLGANAVAYTPPIGAIRVFVSKAEGLKNLEKFGKIDPYARVLVNGVARGRTDVRESTLNPVWNQGIYVAVSSPNQRITLECMDVETMGADRSLGKVDINVSDLFQKGDDDKYVENIDEEPKISRLVSKKKAKGTVTYYVSFYPTIPVLSLEEIQEVDEINEHKRKLHTRATENDEKSLSKIAQKKIMEEESQIKEMEDLFSNKMKLDLDELLQYKSGVLAFSILSGELPQSNCCVQSFFDSNGYARYVTQQHPGRSIRNGSTGDVIIKELEWSITTFRVATKADKSKAEDCLAEVTLPTIELVKNCYYKPSILNLSGNNSCKLLVQISWFPIGATKLPQADLITNTGDLTINVVSANNLISADRNGKSDPFVKFYMDNNENSFFKTHHKKKTLDPTWNEKCEVQINNRVNNYLRIRMMDWDAGNKDDLIGTAILPLANVDPENPSDIDVPLTGPDGEDGGVLHLNFSFNPRHVLSVQKQEKKVTDLASKGLSSGLHAGTSVIGGGLGAVGKIKKGIFGGDKKDNKENAK